MRMRTFKRGCHRLDTVLCSAAAGLFVLTVISGCSGLANYEKVVATRDASPGAFTVITAACPTGKKVLGGGFHGIGDDTLRVSQQFPQEGSDANGNPVLSWQVGVTNQGASPRQVTAYALCAR